MSALKPSRLVQWGLPLLVALIPAYAFFTLALRGFYINGAWWGDAGILASLMWHSGWELRPPLALGGESFFSTHMAFVFWLTSGLSWLLPVTREQFFALFQGVVQGLMALAVYALMLRLGMRRWLAALLAVLFAGNGLVLAASCNPHFELLIVASGLAFLASLAWGRVWLASGFFVLCLITREDAGIHLGLLLLCGVVGLRWQGVAWARLRPLGGYALAALGWSALDLLLQHVLFPHAAALHDVYLGAGFFSKIKLVTIATRLAFWGLYRLYVVLPMVAALLLAERWREPCFIAGFASCAPWLALNLLASSPYAGTLSDYYPFPLILGIAWPLAGKALELQLQHAVLASPLRVKRGFGVLLLCTFIGLWGLQNPQGLRFPQDFLRPPSAVLQLRTDRAVALLDAAPLGRVAADGAVVALAPTQYRQTQIAWWPQPVAPDMVIFFAKGQGTAPSLRLAARAGLRSFYQIPGTRLRIAARGAVRVPGLEVVPWQPDRS